MKKTAELKIVYSDNKDYATITRDDVPGKKVTLFLWDEAQVMRLQEIEKKINAEEMEKSKIPYQPLPREKNRNRETALFILVLVAMLAVATIIKLNSP